jgi:hypothetical protein
MNVHTSSRRRANPAAVPTALLLGLGGALTMPAAPAGAAVMGHVLYGVPGRTTWTVPAGVTGAVFTLNGASGGAETTYQGKVAQGGKGGQVSGFLAVTPGQTYTITIGGAGASVQGFYNTYAAGGAGGYGGGGAGGGGIDPGAGGGGSSQIGLNNGLLFVAAGGGGATGDHALDQRSIGGDAGGSTGADGSRLLSDAKYGAARGGTQTQGGAAGQNDQATGETAGVYGYGGHGGSADAQYANTTGGGGGGAGYYGGGGGGSSSGGGGSSYLAPNALDTTIVSGVNTGNGSVRIDYGSVDGPSIDQKPLPHATAGQPYSHTFSATGWPAASFTPVGGTLPAGLSLSSNGVLSGTLSQPGTYTFTVGATSLQSYVSRQVQLVVDPGSPAVLAAGLNSPNGGGDTVQLGGTFPLVAKVSDAQGNPVPGTAVTFDLLSSGGSLHFSDGSTIWTVTTGSDGLARASAVADTTPGTFSATVSAPGTSLRPVTVSGLSVVATPTGMNGGGVQPAGTLSVPYDDSLDVFGQPQPTVTVASGLLPPGVALAGYHLSGTPTRAGRYSFTLRIDNGAASGPVDEPCSIVIAPKPTLSITSEAIDPGTAGLHPLTFPIALSKAVAADVSVHWRTANGTATSPTHYQAAQGVLTIPAGTTSGAVVVRVKGLATVHKTLSFTVQLASPTFARIAAPQGTATGSIVYH